MLTVRLPPEIEKRLDALAHKTGRSKSFHAREVILRHLDDLEDAQIAATRLREGGPRVTLDEVADAPKPTTQDEKRRRAGGLARAHARRNQPPRRVSD